MDYSIGQNEKAIEDAKKHANLLCKSLFIYDDRKLYGKNLFAPYLAQPWMYISAENEKFDQIKIAHNYLVVKLFHRIFYSGVCNIFEFWANFIFIKKLYYTITG